MRKYIATLSILLSFTLVVCGQDSSISVEWESEDSFQLVLKETVTAKKGAIEISRDGLNPVFYREIEINPNQPLLASKTNRFNKGSYIVRLRTRGMTYETSLQID